MEESGVLKKVTKNEEINEKIRFICKGSNDQHKKHETSN